MKTSAEALLFLSLAFAHLACAPESDSGPSLVEEDAKKCDEAARILNQASYWRCHPDVRALVEAEIEQRQEGTCGSTLSSVEHCTGDQPPPGFHGCGPIDCDDNSACTMESRYCENVSYYVCKPMPQNCSEPECACESIECDDPETTTPFCELESDGYVWVTCSTSGRCK